jgi:acetyl-CoA acetyltransferase
MATLLAGCPSKFPQSFNRLCASGLNAVNQAARHRAGEEVYIAAWKTSRAYSPTGAGFP